MSLLIDVTLGVIAIISVILAVYYQRQNRALFKMRHRYSWTDCQQGVWGLIKEIEKKGIAPQIIVTVTGSGAIIANLFTKMSGKRIPIYHGMIEDPGDPWLTPPKGHKRIDTGKWIVHIPESFFMEDKEKDILYLDSTYISGATMKIFKDILSKSGFNSVQFATLVRVKPSAGPHFKPHFSYFEVSATEFYYPWGKG